MRRRTRATVIALGVAGVSAAAVIACGSGDDATTAFGGSDASFSDSGFVVPTSDAGFAATVSGVVLLHAAAFPAFRVCFENYPDLAPQPDTTTMPEANLVGVEVGSLVRIAPL